MGVKVHSEIQPQYPFFVLSGTILKTSVMDKKLSSTGIIRDISSMREFAKNLLGKGKEYDELLSLIIEKNYYYDDDLRLLKVKDLQEKTNKTYSNIRKQLYEIYNDLLNHEDIDIEFSIKKVEYVFIMHYFDNYTWFVLDNLPIMPRIGEEIDIPFFMGKMDNSRYYVESIDHYFSDTKQSIRITLNPDSPHPYFRLRKDEAYLKREITHDEYYSKKDWKIREKLKLRRF